MEAFLDANQKKLIIIGILAILCIVGYVIYDGLGKMAAKSAAGDVAAARTVPDFDAVSKEHEGNNAGGTALLLKSQLLWRDQQQQEAIKTLESFIESYPEHPAIGSAYASLGSYQQQLGNTEDAKKSFESSVETGSAASSLALLSLGDIALGSGDSDKAQEYYDQILTEYEKSHFQVKTLAEERIKLIGVQAPTDKAPEAPAPTPGATTPPVVVPAPGGPDSDKPAPAPPSPGSDKPKPAPAPAPAPSPEGDTTPDALPELELPDPKPATDTPGTDPKPENPAQPTPPTTPESTEAPASPEGE